MDSDALARRLLSLKGWHWKPGMADHLGCRCAYVADGVPYFADPHDCADPSWPDADAVPNLDDGMTVAGVVLVARELWGRPIYISAGVRGEGIRYFIAGISVFEVHRVNPVDGYDSEAIAAVHALGFAPAGGE